MADGVTTPLAAEGLTVILEPLPGLTAPRLMTARGFTFQCPPLEEFSIDYAHGHTDYETLDDQHSRKGVPQLASAQFDTLVVDYARWVVDPDALPIEELTAKLIKITESGTPFLFTAAHDLPAGGYDNWSETLAGPEAQFPATLRTLRVAERAGEGDARYLNVAFTEYRDTEVNRLALGKKRKPSNKFPTTVKLFWDGHAEDPLGLRIAKPPLHPVTLAALARHFYKDPSWATWLGAANNLGSWGANDALIGHPRFRGLKTGRFGKLTIPKLNFKNFREAYDAKNSAVIADGR